MKQYRIVKVVEAQREPWEGKVTGEMVTYYEPQRKGWFFWRSIGYAKTQKGAQAIIDCDAFNRMERVVK